MLFPWFFVYKKKRNQNNEFFLLYIMEKDVIQIDADISIKNTIGKLMYREENRFYEPFVLLKKDRYYGTATLRDVVIAIGKDL